MLKFYISVAICILVGQCAHEGHSWQDKVVFTKEGGETTITGKSGASGWIFMSKNYFLDPDERIVGDEEIVMRKDWLTISYHKGSSRYLKLKAAPMGGNKTRKLILFTSGAFSTEEEISVFQYPKDSVQLGLKPKQ